MQVQKRSEIEEKYKWKLEDIFASDADWEAEFAQAEALLPQLEAQKECITRGRLGLPGVSGLLPR